MVGQKQEFEFKLEISKKKLCNLEFFTFVIKKWYAGVSDKGLQTFKEIWKVGNESLIVY